MLAVYYKRAHLCTAHYICRIFCCPFVQEALYVLFAFGKGLCDFVMFNHWYLDEMTWHLSSGNFNRGDRDFYLFFKESPANQRSLGFNSSVKQLIKTDFKGK